MTAGAKFREVLAKKGLVEAMAAHSPLSAMLVAEAGFDAIWASGFELSAMYGVPDVSVVSMTQHLDMVRAMATDRPAGGGRTSTLSRQRHQRARRLEQTSPGVPRSQGG